MSILSARSPINLPSTPARLHFLSSGLLVLFSLSQALALRWPHSSSWLLVRTDPGDRPVRPVNAPVSATSPPADPSSRTACPTGGWRCRFPAAVHPVDADLLVCTNRGGAKIHANRARKAVPRMSALHCGLLLCRSTDGEFGNAYPGRGGSPPTPCPSSWGFVLSETL